MRLARHLSDVKELLRAERLMEAESLERHLLTALSLSEHPDHRVVWTVLSDPRDTARSKISAIDAVLRYLNFISTTAA